LKRIQLKLETLIEIASTLIAAGEASMLEERQKINEDFISAAESVGSVSHYALLQMIHFTFRILHSFSTRVLAAECATFGPSICLGLSG
jgi:hypothetical protein